MDERHRALLRTNRLEITSDLRFRDVRRRLLDSGILNGENLDEIENQQSREDQAKALLDILPTKGPNAFAVFRDALKHRYPHLARLLSDEGQRYEDLSDEGRGSSEHWPKVLMTPAMTPIGPLLVHQGSAHMLMTQGSSHMLMTQGSSHMTHYPTLDPPSGSLLTSLPPALAMKPFRARQRIGQEGGNIVSENIVLSIKPNSLQAVEDVSVTLHDSSTYSTTIQSSGLDDILSFFRVVECKPDNLKFEYPVYVDFKVSYTEVPQDHNFLLFGQEISPGSEGKWMDLSTACSLTRHSFQVSFKLQHFSDYILVAVVSSLALQLPSVSKFLIDCLNGQSFPCSFTPYLGMVSGKRHPLTIVCREGYNASTPTPETYRRFGLVRTSEFNLFDAETLTVQIMHVSLANDCSDSYQINRATCKTEEGQAMDMIVEPIEDETPLNGQAVIFVRRFLRVKKVCSLNLTLMEETVRTALARCANDSNTLWPALPIYTCLEPHSEPGGTTRLSPLETMAVGTTRQFPSPSDSPCQRREDDVEEAFGQVVAEVSSRWDDLAGKLKLSRNEIKGLQSSQPDDDHRCREMLHRWMNKNGSDATLQDLKQALIDIGERLTAESL